MLNITHDISKSTFDLFKKNNLPQVAKQLADAATVKPVIAQSVIDDGDSEIGVYHAFASTYANTNNPSSPVLVSDASLAVNALPRTQVSDPKAWEDLFKLVDSIGAVTPPEESDVRLFRIAEFSAIFSAILENVKGQAEFTDELKQEFAAEVERYAPMAREGEINSLLEYVAIRIADIMDKSAPGHIIDPTQPPAPLPDDFSFGLLIGMVTVAFEDTLASGSFFHKADASLWRALDILVTPLEESLSPDGFYQFLKDNAQSIYEDIKGTMVIDPENPYRMFGELKAIIDAGRQQYQAATPVSQMFSEKNLYSL